MIFVALAFLFVLFVVRQLVRREWAAVLATSILLSGSAIAAGSWVAWVFIVTVNVLLFTVLARIGLVAMIAAMFSTELLRTFPFTWPPSAWYSGVGFVAIAVVAGLAVVSFRIATGAHAELRADEAPRR